jgi:hypothetical protein
MKAEVAKNAGFPLGYVCTISLNSVVTDIFA